MSDSTPVPTVLRAPQSPLEPPASVLAPSSPTPPITLAQARQRIANGYYERQAVIDKVIERLLQDLES